MAVRRKADECIAGKEQISCGVAGVNRKGRIIMTVLEKLGIEYIECDGIFYPVFAVGTEKNLQSSIGKYGRIWMAFMKNSHPDRYRSLVRFGRLQEKAAQIDEEAYDLLEGIEDRWLKRRMPEKGNSFMEVYRLRTQARLMAEEVGLEQIVNRYH